MGWIDGMDWMGGEGKRVFLRMNIFIKKIRAWKEEFTHSAGL